MKVYLSSTQTDLSDYRNKIIHFFRKIQVHLISMEDYVADSDVPLKKCLADVETCDIYILLVAWNYGYIPKEFNPHKLSITHLEYEKAIKCNKKCLVFLIDENKPNNADIVKVSAFRKFLEEKHLVSYIKTSDELIVDVVASIHNSNLKSSENNKSELSMKNKKMYLKDILPTKRSKKMPNNDERKKFFENISDELIVEEYLDLDEILTDGIDKAGLENNLFKNGKTTGFYPRVKHSLENTISDLVAKDFKSMFIYIPTIVVNEIQNKNISNDRQQETRAFGSRREITTFLKDFFYAKLAPQGIKCLFMLQGGRDNEYNLEYMKKWIDVPLLTQALNEEIQGTNKAIYLLGLKYKIDDKSTPEVSIDDLALSEDAGFILGENDYLKYQLTTGHIGLQYQGNAIHFATTNVEFLEADDDDIQQSFVNINPNQHNCMFSFEDLDGDSVNIKYKQDAQLKIRTVSFGTNEVERVDEFEDILAEENDNVDSLSSDYPAIVNQQSSQSNFSIYMKSFGVVLADALTKVHFLLVKDGSRYVLLAGQYNDETAKECEVIAEVVVDVEKSTVNVTNHLQTEISFVNDEQQWILKKPDTKKDDLTSDVFDIYEHKETVSIPPKESKQFRDSKVVFIDTAISLTQKFILINYYRRLLDTFDKQYEINRNAFSSCNLGNMIDVVTKEEFVSRVYKNGKPKMLGQQISRKSILIEEDGDEMVITNNYTDSAEKNNFIYVKAGEDEYRLTSNNDSCSIDTKINRVVECSIYNVAYTDEALVSFSLVNEK